MAEAGQQDSADYQDEEYNEDEYGEGEYEGEGEHQEEFQGDAEDGEGLGADEVEKRVQEMEDELEKLSQLQQQVNDQLSSAADKVEENSIYVGQVDYEATAEELQAHFSPCGAVKRVTIICDLNTGHPKGFAYVEFEDKSSVENALKLDDSSFKGRQLKVLPKRQNIHFGRGGRGGRGGGRVGPVYGRGRFSGRAPFFAGRGFRGGFRGSPMGRGPPRGGRAFGGRGRGRGGYGGYFNPYY